MKHRRSGPLVMWIAIIIIIIAGAGVAGWRMYEMSGMNSSALVNGTLTGLVVEGPTTPICATQTSCERVISDHTIDALNSSGNVVASAKTDGGGRYVLHLPQGHYSLVLVPQVGLGRTFNQVNVSPGTTVYNVSVDTGLR